MTDRDDEAGESRRRSLPAARKKTKKPKARKARRAPGRGERQSFFDAGEELAWEEAPEEYQVEREPAGEPADFEEAQPGVEPTSEEPSPPPVDDEPPAPARRVRAPSRSRRSPREVLPAGIPLAMPVAALAAAATLVVTILFTRLGKVDYSNFVFWLVIFTLAAHFELELKGGGTINLGLAPLLGALLALPVSLPDVTKMTDGEIYRALSMDGCVQVVWVFLFGMIITLVTKMLGELRKEDLVGMLIEFTGVGVTAFLFFGLMKLLPQKPVLLGHYTPALLVTAGLCGGVLYLFYLGKSSYIQVEQGYFSPKLYLQSVLRKSWFPFVILGLTGCLMGLLFVGISMWSVLFVLPVLLVFVYAYHRVAATDLDLIETIRVLSAIPEKTGLLESGHGERVARLAEGVARELGLSPEDVKQVEYAAYLHDIGAIAGRGDEDQRQLTESEGVIAGGVDILGQVEYLEVAAEILRGREGLRDRVANVEKRRAVNVGAGILTAVDDFESLLRGGEGRDPLSENEALTEMNLERGVRYDSKVLRAIARVYPRLPKEALTPVVGGSAEESDFWSE